MDHQLSQPTSEVTHRYMTKSVGPHGRPNCLDWPAVWMVPFKHRVWEVYFLQSNFLSESSIMDFLKMTANPSQVISSQTFSVGTECVAVLQFKKTKTKTKTGLHLLTAVENFLQLR